MTRHVVVNLNTMEVERVIDTPLLYSFVRCKLPIEARVRILGMRHDFKRLWWEVCVEGWLEPVIVLDEEIFSGVPNRRCFASEFRHGFTMEQLVWRLRAAASGFLLGETVQVD